MLDNPIIVSDEEIKEGDKCYHIDLNKGEIDTVYDKTKYHTWTDNGVDKDRMFRKIIAGLPGLPQINWNGLESKFGYVDVEKISTDMGNEFYIYRNYDFENGVRKGFKKAQELNDKKFSLEDIENAFYAKENASYKEKQIFFEEFIQSISRSKAFSIEVEMESCSDCHLNEGYMSSPNCCRQLTPKIIDCKIKITKKL